MYSRSIFREANDIIYFVPLACVAILWKPNPNQLSYSYVLLDDDEEYDIKDLELTETVDDRNNKEKELAETVDDRDSKKENHLV